MNNQLLFFIGLFITVMVAVGLHITVREFEKIESGKVPRNPDFPL